MRPEGYDEMDTYLNSLAGWLWKDILDAYRMGGDTYVLPVLRRECGDDLSLWTDEEILDYLNDRDIISDHFQPVSGRM